MHIEAAREYCLSKKGATEDLPFDESTLVFKVMGKMFGLLPLERMPAQINLKCDPERSEELRAEYPMGIKPGFHMNKKHWNTLILEEEIEDRLIAELIDHSYELVVAKLRKKDKEVLENL